MKYLEFDTPATKQAGDLASDHKLHNLGLAYLDRVFWNLPDEALYEAKRAGRNRLANIHALEGERRRPNRPEDRVTPV